MFVRRVPIRLKLAAALSIPLVALAVVTLLEVRNAAADRAEVREQTDLAEAAIGPSGLITTLQNERTWAAVDLIGQTAAVNVPVNGYEETRAQADAAITALRDTLSTKGDAVVSSFRPALDGLDALAQLRADVDRNVATIDPRTTDNNLAFSSDVFDRYTALIEPFFDASTRITLAIDDQELREGTELADTASRQIEVLSLLLNRMIADFTLTEGGIDTSGEIAASAMLHEQFERNAARMLAGTGPYAAVADATFPVDLTDRVNEQATNAIVSNRMELGVVLAAVDVPTDQSYVAYQDAVAAEIRERSARLNDAAEARMRWFLALSGLVLASAVVLAWLVSRSITHPLRSLTRQAKDMAERRLPEAVVDILDTPLGEDVAVRQVPPVELHTRDEVSDVASALNTVQDTALDLAVEQAVLRRNIADSFVNLGRRNQNLLGRQLDFITELETNETDPDALANLFRLDHLATRMRRNAESLLVLAGIEPPRKSAAPVRLTDVIRAALGEVEDYQRVAVRGVEPATILGSAAADLAHLLAELIENALVFSPPDQSVDIRGRNRPEGYTLAIIDSGLGMPATDITAANRRLAGAESFTIAPSKYLGHYVAGNLAARHDIHVQLGSSPGNGITATIEIPPALLTTDTDLAAPVTPPHGNRVLGAGGAPALPAGARQGRPGPADGRLAPAWPASTHPAGDAAPAVRPLPVTGTMRTQSGLVKRAGHAGESSTIGAGQPSGELLDSLRRHTTNLQGGAGPGAPPAPDHRGWAAPPAPEDPARPPAQWAWPSPPVMPAAPPPPAPTWTPTPAPTDWQAPAPAPTDWQAAPPAPAPTDWQAPAPAPTDWQAPPTAPSDWSARPAQGPAGDSTTSAGLTRRVRGAQLPNTQPVRMHRGPEPGAAPAQPGAAPRVRTPEQRRRADDVYSFLSSFTAGVQRGLDDAGGGRSDRGRPG
jgi:signal transduction histidine kinase